MPTYHFTIGRGPDDHVATLSLPCPAAARIEAINTLGEIARDAANLAPCELKVVVADERFHVIFKVSLDCKTFDEA